MMMYDKLFVATSILALGPPELLQNSHAALLQVACVEQWLEHSTTPTCPSCRVSACQLPSALSRFAERLVRLGASLMPYTLQAKVNRRSTRLLIGIECVPHVQTDAANDRLLADKQQQVTGDLAPVCHVM